MGPHGAVRECGTVAIVYPAATSTPKIFPSPRPNTESGAMAAQTSLVTAPRTAPPMAPMLQPRGTSSRACPARRPNRSDHLHSDNGMSRICHAKAGGGSIRKPGHSERNSPPAQAGGNGVKHRWLCVGGSGTHFASRPSRKSLGISPCERSPACLFRHWQNMRGKDFVNRVFSASP